MRALFLSQLEKQLESNYSVDGEQFHHLKNVLRIKENDQILLLDGRGGYRHAAVREIKKKTLQLHFTSPFQSQLKKDTLKVALGMIKKDALELSLKQLVEIGASEIYLFESSFSQRYEISDERIEKILISSLEQSNAKHLPIIHKISFNDLLRLEAKQMLYFCSHPLSSELKTNTTIQEEALIVVGPEGGLSREEEDIIINTANSAIIHLPVNIMRAPTAISFCYGYCMGKMDKED